MRNKEQTNSLKIALAIITFISIVTYSFWKSYKSDEHFFITDLNGIIEKFSLDRGRKNVKLKYNDTIYNLRINQENFKYFEIGDSISKPSKSLELFLFKRDKTKEAEEHFYMESLEKFKD